MFGSTIGWNEIPGDASRYESSSDLLAVSDLSGYSFLNLSKDFEQASIEDCHSYKFEGLVVTMQSSNFNKTSNLASTSICHIFESSTICIPVSAIQNVADNEILQVAVQYKIDVTANIFPSSLKYLNTTGKSIASDHEIKAVKSESSLNKFFVGLAINRNIHVETIPTEPIEIKFIHEYNEVRS